MTSLVLAPDPHLGTKLSAAAALAGPVALGAVSAGAVCTLTLLAPQGIRLLLLCLLGAGGLVPLAVMRCGDPARPKLWIDGLIAALNYGLIVLVVQSLTRLQGSVAVVWNVVGPRLAAGAGAAGAAPPSRGQGIRLRAARLAACPALPISCATPPRTAPPRRRWWATSC
jgi:hypothetical protein